MKDGYDYKRDRSGRDYNDEPHYRSRGGAREEPHWYVDASDIEVSVENGVVTLAGRVDSRTEKRRAEDVAESVSGVTDVSNQLRWVKRAVQY